MSLSICGHVPNIYISEIDFLANFTVIRTDCTLGMENAKR